MLAVSDLHVSHAENRRVFDRLRPAAPDDWLIVAGDMTEVFADIEKDLRALRDRFQQVIWAAR